MARRGKGASIGRKMRRGHADPNGRLLQKRPFNNSKRTKGRAGQELVQNHYSELMLRTRYIKKLINHMVKDKVTLTPDNWITKVREYDSHQLMFDDYEMSWMFQEVNKKVKDEAKRDI
jgi:hypothetical protein